MKSQKESYLRVLLVLGVPAIIEQFLMTLVSYVGHRHGWLPRSRRDGGGGH